jgi:predicted helicase
MLNRDNLGLNLTRRLRDPLWQHVLSTCFITDKTILSSKDNCYFFPLYAYLKEPVRAISQLPLRAKSETHRTLNLSSEFLNAVKESLGSEPTPEEILFYIYAVLYSPVYRKRYEEFLKIDFPRVPLPSNYEVFKELSRLGKELIDLHLLKHPKLDKTEVGFPKNGSNKVEKVGYVEESQRVFINKDQYFERIQKQVWEYQIGAYRAMEKYLKDRKSRKLSLDEINHYMKVAKAILLTIGLQEKIDEVYTKAER